MGLDRRSVVRMLGSGIATGWTLSQSLTENSIAAADTTREIRIGMIGLDTSHVSAFTKLINQDEDKDPRLNNCRVVAAFPAGNPAFPLSQTRLEGFTNDVRSMGVKIVDSIDALLPLVDVVMLESVDGTQHLEQIRPVFAARKPVFIDKPLAASLSDVVKIAELAVASGTPWFTASSSRFTEGYPELTRSEAVGEILGCDTYSQSRTALGHPDLFWYGIHGIDLLYSLMGTGCQSVTAVQTELSEQVTGRWSRGRVGTYRAIREHTGQTGLGATVFGSKGIAHVNNFYNYVPLVCAIVEFFRTKTPPVSFEEMLEVFVFMEAAEESKRRGGVPVNLAEVLNRARKHA